MSIQNAHIHGTTVKLSGTECSFTVFFLILIYSTNGFNPQVSCIVGISNAIRFFPDLLTD